MTKRSKSKSPINLSVHADARAVASAKFVREKKIRETIPADVSRAKASAWLDLISPLTEWAGLKGDELRYKREILRIQRDETLSTIIERARRTLPSMTASKPIPNKFLVPFLEQASLESSDDPLIDLWANLLVSAAEEFNSHFIHFTNIISQISARQGKILSDLIGTTDLKDLEIAYDNISMWYQSSSIRENVSNLIQKGINNWDLESFDNLLEQNDWVIEKIYSDFDRIGIEVVHGAVENKITRSYSDIEFDYSKYSDDLEVDYAILEAVGLIRRVDTYFFDVHRHWSIILIYYHLTNLGFHFAKACKLVK